MHIQKPQMTGSSGMVRHSGVAGRQSSGLVLVLLLGLLGCWQTGQAADFACPAGDVACLINAITTANANGETNTITLHAGTYALTTVHNTTDGPTGLPSVTSTLTITGGGAESTIIERQTGAPLFRLLHVGATGSLTLQGLTWRGGSLWNLWPALGGGIYNAGT